MKRRREIAASPQRSAAEVWGVIGELVADSLDRSPSIERTDVSGVLRVLDGVARMLISGGHLQKNALTLVAGEIWLEIFTVSGGGALTLDENLDYVPGAARAADWTLYVPRVEPLAKLVGDTVKGRTHLSADEPPAPESSIADVAGSAVSPVDLDALAASRKEGS